MNERRLIPGDVLKELGIPEAHYIKDDGLEPGIARYAFEVSDMAEKIARTAYGSKTVNKVLMKKLDELGLLGKEVIDVKGVPTPVSTLIFRYEDPKTGTNFGTLYLNNNYTLIRREKTHTMSS